MNRSICGLRLAWRTIFSSGSSRATPPICLEQRPWCSGVKPRRAAWKSMAPALFCPASTTRRAARQPNPNLLSKTDRHESSAIFGTFHSLTPADREAATAMKAAVAPFKGTTLGPEARASFGEMMRHTPAAEGVTCREDTVAASRAGVASRPATRPQPVPCCFCTEALTWSVQPMPFAPS